MDKDQAKSAIVDFVKKTGAELPVDNPAFSPFLERALDYFVASNLLRSFTEQKAIITGQLLPAERAALGGFRFVLEHNLDPQRGATAPTIQISSTGGNFHALIIKQQSSLTGNYGDKQMSLKLHDQTYQLGIATNRIRASVDLAREFSMLHSLRVGCQAEGRPIIYFLGSARQTPDIINPGACVVSKHTKSVRTVFSILGKHLDDRIMIGVGGGASAEEGYFGIPRMSYLQAMQMSRPTLTTLPEVGMHCRYDNPTLEVLCGKEWGDDSAVLAAVCDAAFVFSPYGTWTQIEMENLLAQKKPFVVIDNPSKPFLFRGETSRIISVERGSYTLYASAEDAAYGLIAHLEEVGFANIGRPDSGTPVKPPCPNSAAV